MIEGLVFIILGVIVVMMFTGGLLSDIDEAFVLAIPAVVFLTMGLHFIIEDHNDRWAHHVECINGNNKVDAIIIDDCDKYYDFPAFELEG